MKSAVTELPARLYLVDWTQSAVRVDLVEPIAAYDHDPIQTLKFLSLMTIVGTPIVTVTMYRNFKMYDPNNELENQAGRNLFFKTKQKEQCLLFASRMLDRALENMRPVVSRLEADKMVVHCMLYPSDPEKGHKIAGCQGDHPGGCYGDLWICTRCGKTYCYAEGMADDKPEICDACWEKENSVELGEENRNNG